MAQRPNKYASDRPVIATAQVTLTVNGKPVAGTYHVPHAPARLRHLLPAARTLLDGLIAAAVDEASLHGESVSCRKGCDACCYQLIPISAAEAYAIRELVRSLPTDRRVAIETRMANVRHRLQASGLADRLTNPASLSALGADYLRAWIPCPFLDNRTCSIHADRPLACREHHVTSAPEHCAEPSPEGVRKLRVPGQVVSAMTRLGPVDANRRWIALPYALDWADEHPEPPPTCDGPALLKALFKESTNGARNPV